MEHRKDRIVLRGEGNAVVGLGHLYRLLAFAQTFGSGTECVMALSSGSVCDLFKDKFRVEMVPDLGSEAEGEWLAKRFPPADWKMVADGYRFVGEWQRAMKDAGYYLIYVDDLASGRYHADVIVNHSLAARAGAYDAGPSSRFALGSAYAMLRPEFISVSSSPSKKDAGLRVFVSFGGADPLRLSYKAASALCRNKSVKEIHAVLGPCHREHEASEIAALSPSVKLHRNLDAGAMAGLMKSCDFGIVSASNTLYEACAARLPVIAGYYVENQAGLYRGFAEKQAIFEGGDFRKLDEREFETIISQFLESNRDKLVSAMQELIDGRSGKRLSRLLTRITYRAAAQDDMMLVFRWSNDPVTRANSYRPEPIQIEDHRTWYLRRLDEKTAMTFVAEVEGRPAGLVRYDRKDGHAVVGVMLDAEFRGQSLSALFLRDTALLFFRRHALPVLAYIKKGNMPSVKAFEQAGYRLSGQQLVEGQDSFVYKLRPGDV